MPKSSFKNETHESPIHPSGSSTGTLKASLSLRYYRARATRRTTRGRNPVGIEETTIAYSRYPRSICMSKSGSIATSTGTRGHLSQRTIEKCDFQELCVRTPLICLDSKKANRYRLWQSYAGIQFDFASNRSPADGVSTKEKNAYSLANLASLCCSGLLLPTSVNKAAIQCSVENTHATEPHSALVS